jgi:anti-sigma28 factor (negative regulator of flagellin synthesis)
MIGIQGIGQVPESSGPKLGPGRAKDPEKASPESTGDGVEFSPQAEEAAIASTVISEFSATNEIRNERIQRAKESIEQGTYKVQDVVRQVASRLTRFVS